MCHPSYYVAFWLILWPVISGGLSGLPGAVGPAGGLRGRTGALSGQDMRYDEWKRLPESQQDTLFQTCVEDQSRRVLRAQRTPLDLQPLRKAIRQRPDLEVVLWVPYGRVETVRILQRYLVRNLRAHGGVVDRVLLFVNTLQPDAVQHALALRRSHSEFALVKPPMWQRKKFQRMDTLYALHWAWAQLNASSALYLRVDDDVIFVEDGAIETLVYAHVFQVTGFLVPFLMECNSTGVAGPT